MNSLSEIKKAVEIYLQSHQDLLHFKNCLQSYCGDDWTEYIQIRKDHYARNIIYSTDMYDILVITWLPGHCSTIHCHPAHGCVLKVLDGRLTEERFDYKKRFLQTYEYPAESVSYIHDRIGCHRVSNRTDQIAVSLHIYSPGKYVVSSLPEKL